MNRSASNKTLLLAASLLILATITRLTVHPFNMTAIGALALFAGARISNRTWAYLLPVTALLVSDLFLGFHPTMLPIYACFLFTVWLGRTLAPDASAFRIATTSMLGSVVFYLLTNLPFFYPGMYSFDLAGALESYSAALPFFRNQLFGDLLYSGLLFGAYGVAVRMPYFRVN